MILRKIMFALLFASPLIQGCKTNGSGTNASGLEAANGRVKIDDIYASYGLDEFDKPRYHAQFFPIIVYTSSGMNPIVKDGIKVSVSPNCKILVKENSLTTSEGDEVQCKLSNGQIVTIGRLSAYLKTMPRFGTAEFHEIVAKVNFLPNKAQLIPSGSNYTLQITP